MIGSVITAIGGIATVVFSISFGGHISTTTPVFVSYTPELYLPRFLTSVLFTQVRHRAFPVESDIFYPLRHFLYGTATHVSTDIRLCTQFLTKIQEFVCSEAIILCNASPMGIDHLRTLATWTDTVTPVVFVGKATARPAQIRYINMFKSGDNIVPHSVRIRNLRVFPYPKAIIDTSSQMFGKLSVDMSADRFSSQIGINNHLSFLLRGDKWDCRKKQ